MKNTARHGSQLPANGPQRELLRNKGQFWTPDWVAEAMVAYVVAGGSDTIFDPAVGAGAFFRAARAIENSSGRRLQLCGTEIDRSALEQAIGNGLSMEDLSKVQITDFLLHPPTGPLEAIVANPPYIRHHRLSTDVKRELGALACEITGQRIDGRAGVHIYFLLRALQLLAPDGRLAFIMPSDTCEGVFAPALWHWISKRYRLDGVITFAPEATPFPLVDTNPIIFLIRNAEPQEHFLWSRCIARTTYCLRDWVASAFLSGPEDVIITHRRLLTEGIATGLSRPPVAENRAGLVLAHFARVLRGIATGANDFFFLTAAHARWLNIPSEFLVPAIGRTRDVPGEEIDRETLAVLESVGRPTLLFSPNDQPLHMLPPSVREYLQQGEAAGLATRPLIAQRHPWYRMEVRQAPPLLFAYLGRRHARFIRNRAGVVPLTGFLCVYPRDDDPDFIDKLWTVLRHPDTLANLSLVGKSYGSGAIKVEPRALERLLIPTSVIEETGLAVPTVATQLALAL